MTKQARAIMFLGTGSDVGKSIAATAFCRILRRRGYRVAPFKAQNMSNNSYVAVEGGEIGRAQAVQAEAALLLPSVHMNPILIKPSGPQISQIVIQGKVATSMSAKQYHQMKSTLAEAVWQSYKNLASDFDVIVLEGAGSCCEMNLKQNDIVNFQMAKKAGAPCIIVADIDRGGVFAQIIGTYHLMSDDERDLTIGFLINKFRGDPELFADGIRYIEKTTGKPVLGLVPYYEDIYIGTEDSVAVQRDKRISRKPGPDTVNVAVVCLPAISNFTDFETLERESDVVVSYLDYPDQLTEQFDCLILPGTKNVIAAALWLKKHGWQMKIVEFAKKQKYVVGICGGYQLLGLEIKDPLMLESTCQKAQGLGLLPLQTYLAKEKIVRKVIGHSHLFDCPIQGYEIHMGVTEPIQQNGQKFAHLQEEGKEKAWEDGWVSNDGYIFGTYVHGLFDSPYLRTEMLNRIRKTKGLKLKAPALGSESDMKLKQYDRLADHFEAHCDVERIFRLAGITGCIRQ